MLAGLGDEKSSFGGHVGDNARPSLSLGRETPPLSISGCNRGPNCALASSPSGRAGRDLLSSRVGQLCKRRIQDGRDGSHLKSCRRARSKQNVELVAGRTKFTGRPFRLRGRVDRHSGMFPCFFGGRLARLPRNARRALMTVTRVAAGSMIPSSSPRSAARKGLATL